MEADDDVEIIVDTESLSLCRLCIQNKGRFQIVKQMQKHMKECFDIIIDSFDGMSQIICETCKKLVCEIVDVRERFRKNQEVLLEKRRQLVTQSKEKRSTSPIYIESDSENKRGELKSLTKSPSKKGGEKLTSKSTASNKTCINDAASSKKRMTPDLIQSANRSKIKENNDRQEKLSRDSTPDPIALDSESPSDSQEIIIRSKKKKTVISESESDLEEVSLSSLKNSIKYMCRMCSRHFYAKNRLKDHIATRHQTLYNMLERLCKPCSVILQPFNQTPQDWVFIDKSKVLKFTPQYQWYFLQKSVQDDDSSSGEDFKTKSNFRRIISKDQKDRSDSKKAKLFHSTDSDSRDESVPFSRYDKESERLVERISDDAASDGNSKTASVDTKTVDEFKEDSSKKSKSASTTWDKHGKLAMSDTEITEIIKYCYATAKIRKSLTAPVKKDWLVKDLNEMSAINVHWKCSPTIMVTRISAPIKGTGKVSTINLLPVAADNMSIALGHLKLMMANPESVQVPTVKPSILNPEPFQAPTTKPSITMLSKYNAIVRKPIQILPKGPETNVTKSFVQTAATKRPTPAIQHKPPESNVNKPETNATKPSVQATATKRLSPLNDDRPWPKKICISTPSLVPFMSPVIISTVSLAKNSETATKNTQEQAVTSTTEVPQRPKPLVILKERPMIKCKPTAALMPSPAKPARKSPPPYHMPTLVPIQPCNDVSNEFVDIHSARLVPNVSDHNENGSQNLNASLPPCPDTTPLLSLNNIVQQTPFTPNSGLLTPTTPTNQQEKNLTPISNQQDGNLFVNYPDAVCYPTVQSSYSVAAGSTSQSSEYIDMNTQFDVYPETNSTGTLQRLKELLQKSDIMFRTALADKGLYNKLLRLVLTIKEKQINSTVMFSSEFIVEVCLQIDGVVSLNVFNGSKVIDVASWSNDFQNELVSALKKPEFIQAMKNVDKNNKYSGTVYKFIACLQNFNISEV